MDAIPSLEKRGKGVKAQLIKGFYLLSVFLFLSGECFGRKCEARVEKITVEGEVMRRRKKFLFTSLLLPFWKL